MKRITPGVERTDVHPTRFNLVMPGAPSVGVCQQSTQIAVGDRCVSTSPDLELTNLRDGARQPVHDLGEG